MTENEDAAPAVDAEALEGELAHLDASAAALEAEVAGLSRQLDLARQKAVPAPIRFSLVEFAAFGVLVSPLVASVLAQLAALVFPRVGG
jgi:hypothetical protein